jgi:pyrimidine-nucleoside phosphorylase
VVATKRDGRLVPDEEIEDFIDGYVRGEVPEELAAAFLMAAYIRGLGEAEMATLTRALVRSGRTVELAGLSRPTVDKHSTGGVADGVTLVFAPLAAAMGLGVAKISGRGLGFTGGTIDKLEAIPGFRTDLNVDELVRQVEEVGCAVATQSPDLVPADGKLYALREATATIESRPLIAASVMSKKLAVRTDLIVLDVKAGSGAFMKAPEDAAGLAEACMALARTWGRRARAAVTDMSQPLGCAMGNALDVAEAVDVLAGRGRGRLRDLALTLAADAHAHLTGGPHQDSLARAEEALASGEALECFAKMVEAQGGDPRVSERPGDVLPTSPIRKPIVAPSDGFLAAVDAEELGWASVSLGAGRMVKDAPVDPSVGIVLRLDVGDQVAAGKEIGSVHARDEDSAERAITRVLGALTFSPEPVTPPPLVHGWFDTEG